MVRRVAGRTGRWLLLAVILLLLAAAVVPFFLDRTYYRGPASDHFDGARFVNPDGEDTNHVPGGSGRAGFLWRQATGSDARPAWPERIAVRPAKPPAHVAGAAMLATWIGHATVLVQTQGFNILTDPIYAERAGPFGLGPQRVARPGVAFDDLPRIDIVLVSHDHYDHMDLAALKRLWERDRPLIVTSLGNGAILRDAGIPGRSGEPPAGVQALDWGGVASPAGYEDFDIGNRARGQTRIVVARSHHWGSRWFRDRNRALWSSFVVKLPSGGNLFFAGDTGMGDGAWADEAARYGPIRLAIIPIGAFRFAPGEMASGSHISPVDAVEVFRRLGAATAIPVHWGTFRLSYEGYDTPPRLLAAAMGCTRQPGRFAAVPIGRTIRVPPVGEGPIPALAARRVTPPPVMSRAALFRCLDTPAVRALR